MRPFAPTVRLAGSNAAVTDVELLNSYIGVNATGAPRHYIARIQGQPIAVGVFVDQTFDIGRIEDCHFNPWGPGLRGTVGQFQLRYGRAFVIERSDWEYVFNTFAFGYAIGYHFTISTANFNPGIENSKGCNGNFVGIGADYCRNASVLQITFHDFVFCVPFGFHICAFLTIRCCQWIHWNRCKSTAPSPYALHSTALSVSCQIVAHISII